MAGDGDSNEYGILLAEYEGTGTLLARGGREVACSFRAFQLRNGRVVVLSNVQEPFAWAVAFRAPEAVTGTTSQGLAVTATGLSETNYLARSIEPQPGVYYACRAQSLDASASSADPGSLSRFDIVNLSLGKKELVVPHPSGRARLRRTGGYGDTIRRLKTIKGIDVTAELEVEAAGVETRDSVADDICYLLSVARGTKVQWISRVDYSAHGAELRRYHSSRVTKPYCPLPPIDPSQPNDTDVFLEASIDTYLGRRDKWELSSGLIDAYLDSKSEADYLQARGVKLAVAIEMLKQTFVRASGQGEFVRSKSEFDAIIPDFKKAISDVLSQRGWQGSERSVVYGNIRGLNRIPFRKLVTSLCSHLGLDLPELDVKLFVRCRNSLVHNGCFYCQTADEDDRSTVQPHATPTDEYFWLVHLMDRLFLRLVGYRGPYIDWSDVENPARKETF